MRHRCRPGAGNEGLPQPDLSCGTCIACRKDKPNCCTAIKVLGVHTDGAFCEEIAVPAGNVYEAGDLSLGVACTVEFLAIGAHAVRRSMAPTGSSALVIGAGPIGLGTALFSRIAGHEGYLARYQCRAVADGDGTLRLRVGDRWQRRARRRCTARRAATASTWCSTPRVMLLRWKGRLPMWPMAARWFS